MHAADPDTSTRPEQNRTLPRGGILANALLYQGVWLAGVLGAAAQRSSIGLAAAGAAVLWHLRSARAPRRALALVGFATLTGALFESALLATGSVRMAPALLLGGLLPVWMVALWASFATTLNVALRRLRGRYLLGALLAGVGAPLAYDAGARFGALQWADRERGLLLVALGWAALMPLLMRAAQRFDGFACA